MHTPSSIRVLFKDHRLRWTPQREMIFAVLAATKAHPTADELYRTVATGNGRSVAVSLATVYNALETFVEHGICRRLPSAENGPPAAARYDADVFEHAHVALAGAGVTDLPEDLSRKLSEAIPASLRAEIERRLGITIRRVSIQIVALPGPNGASGPT